MKKLLVLVVYLLFNDGKVWKFLDAGFAEIYINKDQTQVVTIFSKWGALDIGKFYFKPNTVQG